MLGIVLSLSAALGFGASAVFARLGMQHMRSTTATMVSLATSTAVTLAIALALHSSEIPRLGGVSYLWLLLAGVLTFPLGQLLNYTAVRLAGVSKASPAPCGGFRMGPGEPQKNTAGWVGQYKQCR